MLDRVIESLENAGDLDGANEVRSLVASLAFFESSAQRAGGPPTPEIFGLEIPLLQAMVEYKHLMFFDRLIDRGLVKRWPSGYEITAEGRAALDAEGRRFAREELRRAEKVSPLSDNKQAATMERKREGRYPMHGGIHPSDRPEVERLRSAYADGYTDALAALRDPSEEERLREALEEIAKLRGVTIEGRGRDRHGALDGHRRAVEIARAALAARQGRGGERWLS